MNMAKEGTGTVYAINKKTWIYIPLSVSDDSAFPFKKGDKVKIRIEGKKLIIERV